MNQLELHSFLRQLNLPKKDSHKGQNGKLLLIGGSELFHAASKWSLDVASKIVDMVFYSSVTSNNELVQEAKGKFWNGIVIPRENLEDYIQESDCILVGPGMERNQETEKLINHLLQMYPNKKFVIDAGALQMLDPKLLNQNHIVTPHTKEMGDLQQRAAAAQVSIDERKTTILRKGVVDTVTWFENDDKRVVEIEGGNEGMTKGGTGDALAGLVAALYCTNTASVSAVIASKVNKLAGDELYKTVGPFFNASDLVVQIPKTLWQLTFSSQNLQ